MVSKKMWRRTRTRAPFAAAPVALAMLAVMGSTAGAAVRAPCDSEVGLISTLGVWQSFGEVLTEPADPQLETDVFGVGTGLGDTYSRATVRVTTKAGVPDRWAVCVDRRLIADLPVQRVRGARIVGLSVNGRRVAWRTSLLKARGAIYVGVVRGKHVVVERRATNHAIRGSRAVNGRIVVMANGTTAWSLPDRGVAGVWLWPNGESPRRVAHESTDDDAVESFDVRVIDDHHVFVGETTTLAAYRPTRPGTCPAPNGSRAVELSGSKVFVVDGVQVSSEELDSWSWLVVCDRKTGRYLPPRLYGGGAAEHGPFYLQAPKAAYKTAGVVVVNDVATTDASPQSTTTVFAPGGHEPFVSGTPGGPGIPAFPKGTAGAGTAPAPTVEIIPGAVAWVYDGPRPSGGVGAAEVWLADAEGARRIGLVPNDAGKALNGPALELQLDSQTVSWNVTTGHQTANVVPVPGDTVRRVGL